MFKEQSIESLLQKAEKLHSEIDLDVEMPRIERNLKQLSEIGKDLWERTNYSTSRDSCDIRASVLLGSKGYDLQKVSQHLESLSIGRKLPILETVKESGDLQSFLKLERDIAFLSVIEKAKETTLELVNKNYWNFMDEEWDNYKNKILKPFTAPDGTIESLDLSILDSKDFNETSNTNKTLIQTLNATEIKDIEFLINRISVDQNKTSDYNLDVEQLYQMKNCHTKAISLLNNHLSSVICDKKLANSKRERLENFALKIAEKFCTCGHNADKKVAGTLFLLLDLMTFFHYYHNRAYNDALDTIQRLDILPMDNSEIKEKVNKFGQFSEEIRTNIPEILYTTINILYAQFQEIDVLEKERKNGYGLCHGINHEFGFNQDSINCQEFYDQTRKKVKALLAYAGMIPYRLPYETSSKLVQLDVSMSLRN